MLNRQIFHLLIADLDYLRSIRQSNWLTKIQRNSFVPVIVLSNTLEEDVNDMIQIGADIRDLCNERGKTILISSHILSEIALLADDIGIIDHGRIIGRRKSCRKVPLLLVVVLFFRCKSVQKR